MDIDVRDNRRQSGKTYDEMKKDQRTIAKQNEDVLDYLENLEEIEKEQKDGGRLKTSWEIAAEKNGIKIEKKQDPNKAPTQLEAGMKRWKEKGKEGLNNQPKTSNSKGVIIEPKGTVKTAQEEMLVRPVEERAQKIEESLTSFNIGKNDEVTLDEPQNHNMGITEDAWVKGLGVDEEHKYIPVGYRNLYKEQREIDGPNEALDKAFGIVDEVKIEKPGVEAEDNYIFNGYRNMYLEQREVDGPNEALDKAFGIKVTDDVKEPETDSHMHADVKGKNPGAGASVSEPIEIDAKDFLNPGKAKLNLDLNKEPSMLDIDLDDSGLDLNPDKREPGTNKERKANTPSSSERIDVEEPIDNQIYEEERRPGFFKRMGSKIKNLFSRKKKEVAELIDNIRKNLTNGDKSINQLEKDLEDLMKVNGNPKSIIFMDEQLEKMGDQCYEMAKSFKEYKKGWKPSSETRIDDKKNDKRKPKRIVVPDGRSDEREKLEIDEKIKNVINRYAEVEYKAMQAGRPVPNDLKGNIFADYNRIINPANNVGIDQKLTFIGIIETIIAEIEKALAEPNGARNLED